MQVIGEYRYKEVYKRPLNIGDYILIRYENNYHKGNELLVRIGDDGAPIFNNIPLVNHKHLYCIYCYKIENPSVDVINFYNSGYVLFEGQNDMPSNGFCYTYGNLWVPSNTIEMCNRKLSFGMFVMWFNDIKSSYGMEVHYGLLIGSNKVLLDTGITKVVKIVYKVENPSQEEINEYEKLTISFNKYQKGLLESTGELKVGNAYLSSSSIYIYLGKKTLDYELITYQEHNLRVIIPDKYFETTDVFLVINISTARGLYFWEMLQKNKISNNEFNLFIAQSGIKYNVDGSILMPSMFRYGVRRSTLKCLCTNIIIDSFNIKVKYDFGSECLIFKLV